MKEERKVMLILESLSKALEDVETEMKEMEKSQPSSENAGVFELALKSKKQRKADLKELYNGIKDNYIPQEKVLTDIFDQI
ncbi:MAG: hypothetical protein UMU04_01880 [Halanaerobiales bacterium]|nr:hypothetical protein [Halanaerobiales bacterium]